MRNHLTLWMAAVALAISVPRADAAAPAADAGHGVTTIGHGADQVLLMRPSGPVRVIVVFLHGWTTGAPAVWAPWLHHLRARGVLVVYPVFNVAAVILRRPRSSI